MKSAPTDANLSAPIMAACAIRKDYPSDSYVATAYFYLWGVIFYHGAQMGMQLNIKSEDAYRMASRLSALTGESLTAVVTKALRAELERQERNRDREAEARRMLAMGREIRAHMREPVSSDLSDLYDENGLPL